MILHVCTNNFVLNRAGVLSVLALANLVEARHKFALITCLNKYRISRLHPEVTVQFLFN